MFNVITKPSYDFEVISSRRDALKLSLSQVLSSVSPNYPGFEAWLNFTFLKNIPTGERKILVSHSEGFLTGLALLKDSEIEKKICTFFVLPDFRGSGVGSELMRQSLRYFGDTQVDITVSETRIHELRGLLNTSGFDLVAERSDVYVLGKKEFYFSTAN